MDKKKVWLLTIIISILITTIILIITLTIGGSGRSGTDSSGIPFGSFFVIFILPGIIVHQKIRREKMKKQGIEISETM